MTYGSLFSGIGGLDLGLDRAGMKCSWQVEINEHARRVLAKHWPGVRRWDDVRTFPPPGDWSCDLICGGFPCQDISASGKGAGIEGKQSGLWGEFARIIRVIRPKYVLVENSPILTARGLGRVLGDMAALGFDAEWSCVSACSLGAPHTRDRMFVMAHTQSTQWREIGPQGRHLEDQHDGLPAGRQESPSRLGECAAKAKRQWVREPDVARVAHGVPSRLDRLRGLGNAVVPQVAEWISRRLMECTQ